MQTPDHEQFRHAMLPDTTADEFSRQEFVKSFKLHLATNVSPNNRLVYENEVKPAFAKSHSREPANRHEIRKAMAEHPHYQTWSSLLRTSQELMWKACQGPVERQLDQLISTANQVQPTAGGTLKLNPDLPIPRYLSAVDIHCQPGNYFAEVCDRDVSAGAVYDAGVYVYAMGRLGPLNDDMGASQAVYIKKTFPDLSPKRILDLGCAAGHSTLPYKTIFPEADVYAVDVAAPMLRYAHARAESLGVPVHFSQQNAEALDFEDGYFDLIVSHILIHETSTVGLGNIMKECRRLLSANGLSVHSETPPYKGMEDYDAFILDWDAYNNNEPFWSKSHEFDPVEAARIYSFDPDKTFEAIIPSVFEEDQARRTNVFQGGDFGGSGMWYVFGLGR